MLSAIYSHVVGLHFPCKNYLYETVAQFAHS